MDKKVTTLIVVIVLVVLGYFMFKGFGPKDDMQLKVSDVVTTPVAPVEEAPITADKANPVAVKVFTVVGSSFAFNPSTINVNKGDKVRIIFKNSGGLHDFKIDEFNVATQRLNGGQEETVEFVATKSGSFEYYCSVGTHRQMGMVGTLIVK